jgi:hypothetical protein
VTKEIAVDLARWCCPAFAVQVMKWTVAILEGNLAGVIPDAVSQYDNLNNSKSIVAVVSKKRNIWENIDIEERKLVIEDKRQKLELEKQNHLLMLYERPIFATDNMMKQLIKDRLANFIKDNSSSPYKSGFCKNISEIAYNLGYKKLSHIERSNLGKYVAKAFRTKFPTETIFKTERFIMGKMRSANAYSVDNEDWLTEKVNEWCTMTKIRKRH